MPQAVLGVNSFRKKPRTCHWIMPANVEGAKLRCPTSGLRLPFFERGAERQSCGDCGQRVSMMAGPKSAAAESSRDPKP